MGGQTSGWSGLIGLLVVVGFLFLRFRKLATPRKQALGATWLLLSPLIALALIIVNFASRPPQGLEWLWLVVALPAGAVLGWWWGKMMTITVHPVTLAATSEASPAALLFLVVLVAVRYGMRSLMLNEASAWHLRLPLIVGSALVFGFGLLTAQRVEMFLRASRLVAARQAGPMPPQAVPMPPEVRDQATVAPMSENLKLVLLGGAVFTAILIVGLALVR